MNLQQTTEKIKQKLAQGGTAIEGKKIAFDFGEQGCIIINGQEVSNEMQQADCTLSLTLDLFNGILAGEENPQMAVMSGKVQIKGDMGLAMKLNDLLG